MNGINNIFITLIIPVYNVQEYLEECLDSVVQQFIPFDEVILVNDGSTDQSLNICKKYTSRYQNLKLINHENQGLSAARNTGIYNAENQYIMFLDSDDYLRHDTVKILKNRLKRMSYDAIFFDAEIHCEKGCETSGRNIYDRSNATLDGIQMSGWDYFVKSYPQNYVISACMAVYSKETIIDKGITFPEGLYFEDNYFTFAFLNHAKKVIHISEKLYQRRYRKNSIMVSQYSNKKLIDYTKVISLIRDEIFKNCKKKLFDRHEPLLDFISDYCVMLLDKYQLMKEKKIVLSYEAQNLVKDEINNYLILLSKLSLKISDLNLSTLTRILNIFHNIILWKLVQEKDLIFQIREIIQTMKKLYICKLEKLPLGNFEYNVGIYGSGKHTEGLFAIYEKLIGNILCDLVFIDSKKDNESYKGKKLIHLKRVDKKNFDIIIISSFIYEQEMINNLMENSSVCPIYTFYKELNGDIFSNYKIFLEYC